MRESVAPDTPADKCRHRTAPSEPIRGAEAINFAVLGSTMNGFAVPYTGGDFFAGGVSYCDVLTESHVRVLEADGEGSAAARR
jgi:hypothetical protein